MRRREKEIRDHSVLEELLHSAPVCRIGLAPGPRDAGEGENSRPRGDSLRADCPYEGYPYVVPVHFAHAEGRIYFHSAKTGRKFEMLKRNPRVCVEIDEFLGLKTADKACDYGTRFRSLIAFGRARVVTEVEEKRRALQLLMGKYAGRSFAFSEREIEKVAIVEIQVEEITGKQG